MNYGSLHLRIDEVLHQKGISKNQICKDLDKIQMNTDILYKIKQTSPQSSLNRQARGNNLKNVYIVKKQEIIYNKRVLLIDDIYTTGNTANECSKALKKSGVHQIRSTYIIERLKVGIKWKI